MPAFTSLATFQTVLDGLPTIDIVAEQGALARNSQLTKPPGSLGRLEVIAHWLAAWQGQHPPEVENIAVRVFAGNHGVVAKGVSAYPPEVTAQMVANFEAGGAAVNQLCKAVGADLQVIAIDLETREVVVRGGARTQEPVRSTSPQNCVVF